MERLMDCGVSHQPRWVGDDMSWLVFTGWGYRWREASRHEAWLSLAQALHERGYEAWAEIALRKVKPVGPLDLLMLK